MSTERLSAVSWNIAHRPLAWTEVVTLDADVVLLQEANPNGMPVDGALRVVAPPTSDWRIGKTGAYATAIVVLNPEIEFSVPPFEIGRSKKGVIEASDPGQFNIIRIARQERDLYLISLYGLWAHGYADASIHRAISDLSGLLDSRCDVLLAGDLNTFRDHSLNGNRTALLRHQSVFSRLAIFGLECIGPYGDVPMAMCPCNDEVDCRHVRTYRHLHKASTKPLQLDFAFGTRGVRDNVNFCEVLDEERYWAVSDHAPLRVVLNL